MFVVSVRMEKCLWQWIPAGQFRMLALVPLFLAVAIAAPARAEDDRRPVVVQFRDGALDTLTIDKFDRKQLRLRFKDGKNKIGSSRNPVGEFR